MGKHLNSMQRRLNEIAVEVEDYMQMITKLNNAKPTPFIKTQINVYRNRLNARKQEFEELEQEYVDKIIEFEHTIQTKRVSLQGFKSTYEYTKQKLMEVRT